MNSNGLYHTMGKCNQLYGKYLMTTNHMMWSAFTFYTNSFYRVCSAHLTKVLLCCWTIIFSQFICMQLLQNECKGKKTPSPKRDSEFSTEPENSTNCSNSFLWTRNIRIKRPFLNIFLSETIFLHASYLRTGNMII